MAKQKVVKKTTTTNTKISFDNPFSTPTKTVKSTGKKSSTPASKKKTTTPTKSKGVCPRCGRPL